MFCRRTYYCCSAAVAVVQSTSVLLLLYYYILVRDVRINQLSTEPHPTPRSHMLGVENRLMRLRRLQQCLGV